MAKTKDKTVQNVAETISEHYLYEHCDITEAERLRNEADNLYIVETINWTFANGDRTKVHRNRYFSVGLMNAITLAIKVGIESLEVGEEVVAIRKATEQEEETYALILQEQEIK